jgi:outer membrane protein OmpA-like peptidoglycan-associated protein
MTGKAHRPARTTAPAALSAAALAAFALAGCTATAQHTVAHDTVITRSPQPASALVVILDTADTRQVALQAAQLLTATARTGEHLAVIAGPKVVLSSTAPAKPTNVAVAAKPVLPAGATEYTKSKYAKALATYNTKVKAASRKAEATQRSDVARWADMSGRTLTTARVLPATDLPASVGQAETTFLSLSGARVDVGNRKVIVILGDGQAHPAPTILGELRGANVVVAGFTGDPDAQASWQADFVQAGAAQAIILNAGAAPELVAVVNAGLGGATVDPLPSTVTFALGSATLPPTAAPALTELRRQLTEVNPAAAATINGYTDSLGTAQDNAILSQRRAQAIKDWLINHGVAAGRLRAVGHGDTTPVARDSPTGQSANRRVIVVIDPVG